MINPYYKLAKNYWFISPTIYKSRFYKDLILLTEENVFDRNVEPELLFLKSFLSQKSIFLDIGAGLGNYIYYLDSILFPENIHAFEPNKKLFKRLKNIFPKVNVYNQAVSDKNIMTELKIPTLNKEELHTESYLSNTYLEEKYTSITQKVETTCIDNWIDKMELTYIDFIKVDVLGHELSILEGAKDTIKNLKPTLMISIEQKYHKDDIWDTISEIKNMGYVANYLNRKNFKIEPITKEIINYQNTIFAEENSHFIKNIIFTK